MGDPKPVTVLLLAQLGALVLLGAWWLGLPLDERLARLQRIQVQEQSMTMPPLMVWEQPQWLWAHRLVRLQGMAVLVGVGLVIGVAEGMARRARDPMGGFRLTLWTCGVVGMALLPGCVVGYLLAPWVLPVTWVAWGVSGLVGIVGYCLGAGRPYIP